MRGHYELILSDGRKIPLRFCTWSLKRFCKLQGIGPSEMGETLSGENSLEAIANLLIAAAEYPLYKEGITPYFTDFDACDWIDDMGGIGGEKFQKVLQALTESMNSGIEDNTPKKGKKSEVKKN